MIKKTGFYGCSSRFWSSFSFFLLKIDYESPLHIDISFLNFILFSKKPKIFIQIFYVALIISFY